MYKMPPDKCGHNVNLSSDVNGFTEPAGDAASRSSASLLTSEGFLHRAERAERAERAGRDDRGGIQYVLLPFE
jgi:hypothetical protein